MVQPQLEHTALYSSEVLVGPEVLNMRDVALAECTPSHESTYLKQPPKVIVRDQVLSQWTSGGISASVPPTALSEGNPTWN